MATALTAPTETKPVVTLENIVYEAIIHEYQGVRLLNERAQFDFIRERTVAGTASDTEIKFYLDAIILGAEHAKNLENSRELSTFELFFLGCNLISQGI